MINLASAFCLVALFQLAGWLEGYEGALSWVAAGLFAILAFSVVAVFDYWRLWFFWRPRPMRRASALVVDLLAVVGMLTTFVGYLLAALHEQGWVEVQGTLDARGTFRAANAACAWHFLDSIPALKVPQTMNWELTHPFTDKLSGVILLGYKLLVVLPIVAIVTEFIRRARGTHERPGTARHGDRRHADQRE